jgi:predicted phage tail protein
MPRGRTIRVVVLLVVVVSAVTVLAAVLAPVALGWSTDAGVARLWWLMPLAAAGVLGGVTWMLLLETPKREQGTPGTREAETCPACGREVASGWRLCPWCGARAGRQPPHR